jgi:Xaa-Pro aminopeptidase
MVVTIEPGFYCIPERLKGERFESVRSAIDPQKLELLRQVRGIRIEDDVLVTSGEARVLSAAIPKSRSELETVLDV